MTADLSVVLAELDRIASLPTVAKDSGRANSFDTGARWTIRMIREAIERGAPAPSPQYRPDPHRFDGGLCYCPNCA